MKSVVLSTTEEAMAVHIDDIRERARKKAQKDGTTVEEALRAIIASYEGKVEIDYSERTSLDFTGSFDFGASTKSSGTPTSKS